MTKARDLSKLLSTANGKIAGANLDVSFENITDTGTEGTRVATGTTAQRGSTTGQLRFNTTTGLAEYYTGSEFKAIDTPPAIVSVNVTNIETDLGGTQTFVITGTLFNAGATVKFRDNGGTEITPDTTTINSASQITVTKTRSSFSNANEPYDIIVTNPSGLLATLDDAINVDNSPVWTTSSGSLGNILEGSAVNVSATATDPDGDTVSYSETGGTVLSTNSLTLNSSTGAITGTAPTVLANTTLNFTLRATANSNTSDRAFSIGINDLESSLQNPLTTSGAFGWGNATNFTWSTSSTADEFGSPSYLASGTPATSSTSFGADNSYQHYIGSGDGYIGVDLGSGRSLKVYRTMAMGWSGGHYCLNNYVKGSNDGSNWYNVATWSAHPDNGGNYNRGYLQSSTNSNFYYNFLNANASDYWITATNNTAYRYFRLGGTGWDISNGYQIVSNWWLFGLEG
jgi:hypothetical protein